MRALFKTPLAAAAASMLVAASTACAPRPVHCSPRPDRLDSNRGFTRENYAEVHPAMAATAVAVAAVGMLAGARCN